MPTYYGDRTPKVAKRGDLWHTRSSHATRTRPTLRSRLLNSWLVVEVSVRWWNLQDMWRAWRQHDER